ncbi:glutamine--fructose-6-phosphate transaminase (isomerizing) [Salinarimonas ramus]|uniref:Glutamine--fructose-6-phosphate aminotransferase [isomerizing] n=1 Tax=Salinarimonas ramus TaxID=690164 RepID=A0A917QFT6_9HYPH|nr:glutamine--fructose-6-phosphate transaminase (isomerizing) [Salinarimonas ramus]GGK48651.1 glutamine--fructose-6-phosphate aminotransferase [isomerizing] [Salinarimonas ramus]
MCGIIGILGRGDVADQLVDALKRLEYRGYDSTGIATLQDGRIARRRAEGKLRNLEVKLASDPLPGRTGIGHTRWATHGRPTEANAHPHATDRLALVHNGIIENYRELRFALEDEGVRFSSETDTEVVAQAVSHEMASGLDPQAAVLAVLPRLRGAFALAFLFEGEEDLMIGARRGSPLAVGYGDGEMFLGSDALALAPFSDDITYLEEGDVVVATRAGASFFDESGTPVARRRQRIPVGVFAAEKGNHRHYMIKEIYEQPEVVARTLAPHLDIEQAPALDWKAQQRLTITACGTAFYAGLVAKYWFERLGRLPVEIDVASEFRYREAPLPEKGLMIVVSQSGETADTLAGLRYAKAHGQTVLAVVNVPTSSMAREADLVAQTHAGPEIGVASTKAFTCQLATLFALALQAGRARGHVSAQEAQALAETVQRVPGLMHEAMALEPQIEALARDLAKARDVLYFGRGAAFPIAMEGALKLKEISYIHAEGYAAGELKHGPIALIDETTPVVVVAPYDHLFEKTISNMQEVAARGGRIVLITDEEGAAHAHIDTLATLVLPKMDPLVAPIAYAVPVQLIAYHTAVFMGKDVDQPRNLAKSVTVE